MRSSSFPFGPPGSAALTGSAAARRLLSRRAFLSALGAAGAVAAGAGALSGCTSGPSAAPPGGSGPGGSGAGPTGGSGPGDPVGRVVPGAVDGRVLVVVDLQGGNDGLSTLVPYTSSRYRDLRPNLAVPGDEVLAGDGEVGFHPSLERLARRGLVTVEGVGPMAGDLSHFDMSARWQRGDVDGTGTRLRTGFLGRLTDALDDGSPLVGVALGGSTPHLVNDRASTMSLDSLDALWFLEPADWSEASAYQQGLAAFGGDDQFPAVAAGSYRQLLDLAGRLSAGGDADGRDVDWDHPMVAEGGELGWQLYLAADLIGAGLGTRVVYAGVGGYDTHTGHAYAAEANLAQLDVAVDGFLSRADELGFADRVLVTTISEFGRRVPENGSGLDHGNASTMLVAGPVGDRRAGERPPLDDLDENDNLRTTIGFDRYLATLAQEWLGVEAASVLPGAPEPLGLL